MDAASIQAIVDELKPLLISRAPGKIFQSGTASFTIDFGLRDAGYLFISVEPAEPRLYLIKRKVRDLEKQSTRPSPFSLALRKELSDTKLIALDKDVDDRIVRFDFGGRNDLGEPKQRRLVAQLTGRSANLLLLDENQSIIQRARPTDISGQQIGDHYREPATTNEAPPVKRESKLLKQIRAHQSPSEAADTHFTQLREERLFSSQAAAARTDLRRRVNQQQKLLKQLQSDFASHAGAEEHKKLGDLLLANLSTAIRRGNRLTLIDYFSADSGTIEIDLDESTSLQEEATRHFEQYSRSKRAVAQIQNRLAAVQLRLRELEAESASLEQSLATGQMKITPESSEPAAGSRKLPQRIPGTRRYLSSDGFEILVGRTAADNDRLTFKVGKPNDTWLHAADYGGSHVVVRNSSRKPLPHRTLVEAAQLAAWFSQAKKDPKVDVHYTERKFVSKIKGGKPGLVRLQRFKSITVAPQEAGTRE